MNYELLQQLIREVANFEAEHGQADLATFSSWLVDRSVQNNADLSNTIPVGHYDINEAIASYLGKMEAYAKHYTKKILRDSELASQNDYVFLIILERLGDHRKTDLISRAIMEVSSGTEVIKRLMRNGLIEDYPDPKDKRSKQVRLTEKGRTVLNKLNSSMEQLGSIVSGNLTEQEKHQLARLLQKLEVHHQQIWDNDQEASLEDILARY